MKVLVILLIFFIAISINESYAEMSYSEFQNFCKETENMNFDLMPVDQRLLASLCDFLELGLPEKYWDWIGSDLDWKNFAQNVSNEYAQEIPLFVEKGHKDSLIVNTSISGRDSFPPPMSAYISFYYDEDNKTKRFGEKYTVKITGKMIKTKDSRLPPLKLFDIGYHLDEIQCKENLVLIQKYDGTPACVTESTKTKLIERGWTSSSTTVMINSNFEQDRNRIYTDPRNAVIDLEKNNSVKWINNADYAVQVYDYENKSWSTGQIDPSMSDSIQFNSTGYYEFAVESANDRHFGEIIVISDDTNSLPIETRMKMGMSIVSNDLGKNPALIGVGTGDVNDGIVIDINQKELEKRDDAKSYYYDMYKEMIPFDVPITIEFTEPLRLLE